MGGAQADDSESEDDANYEYLGPKQPTLEEVMLDPDFIEELRGGNVELSSFITLEKLMKAVDYLIEEPNFQSNPERCYKLPFIACELFTSDVITVTRFLLNESEQVQVKKASSRKLI